MSTNNKSNSPMILAIIGFVASIPGLLCTGMCASLSDSGGAFMTFSLIPSFAGFIFGFMSKSKATLSGIILILCSITLLFSTIVTLNWFWGLITVGAYFISGVLSFQNK